MAKKERVINRYDGKLSARQITEGINAAARNAQRLYEDADILFKAKRFPTACSLAALSIEESGKAPCLRGILAAQTQNSLKDAWRLYRNHRAKNTGWIMAGLAAKGVRTLAELAPIVDGNSDHPEVLDTVKQLGLYTDCYGDGNWSEPHDAISESLAKQILFVAEMLLTKRETTEREMELWMEHVGRHWGTPEMLLGAIEF